MKVRLYVATFLIAFPAIAESPLGELSPEDCPDLLQFSEADSRSLVAPLIIEAVRRYCAAIGGIQMPDDLRNFGLEDGTRSAVSPEEESERAKALKAGAQIYLETAQQVDPEAANDLLRRLLGSGAKPQAN